MQPLTQEWVDKAEGDFGTANRELQVTQSPNDDAVCFHAQQCIEKYLKAKLQEVAIPFGKTHQLTLLLDLLLPVDPQWEALRADLQTLTTFAVAFRHSGADADLDVAAEAVALCQAIRNLVRLSLGLSL